MILAIDTSTVQGALALLDGETVRAELAWTAKGNHSRLLTPSIQRLLELEGRAAADIHALVVASGPGSFSGLRVGISEGKGLAMALDVPLAGIPTLDVIAFQAVCCAGEVVAVLPAGRDRVYLARYRGGVEHFERIGEYRLLTVDAAREEVGTGLLAGEGAGLVMQRAAEMGQQLSIEPPVLRLRRAGYLAELGRRYLDSGGADQRDVLEPLYLQRSAAEEKLAAMARE